MEICKKKMKLFTIQMNNEALQMKRYRDDVISFKEIARNNGKIMLRFASCSISSAAPLSWIFKTKSSLVVHIPN